MWQLIPSQQTAINLICMVLFVDAKSTSGTDMCNSFSSTLRTQNFNSCICRFVDWFVIMVTFDVGINLCREYSAVHYGIHPILCSYMMWIPNTFGILLIFCCCLVFCLCIDDGERGWFDLLVMIWCFYLWLIRCVLYFGSDRLRYWILLLCVKCFMCDVVVGCGMMVMMMVQPLMFWFFDIM